MAPKFNRKKGARRSFLKNLIQNLIMIEKIETTETRAKAIRPIAERLVSIAKKGQLANLRVLISRISNKRAAMKLFYEIAPKYKERVGGYLRIVKLGGARKRDAAKMARVEFL